MVEVVGGNLPLPAAPWGPLLAGYFVLVGLPSGLTMMTCWYRTRWPSGTVTVERHSTWISLFCLLLASGLLVADLGRPTRFFLMLTRFDNLGSPIAVGAKLIAVKAFLLIAALYLRRRGAHLGGRIDTALTWTLGITSVALAIYPVAVLSRTWLAPLASTSGAALIYLLTALLMGVAVHLMLQVYLAGQPMAESTYRGLRDITLVLLMVHGVALVFEALTVYGEPTLDTVAAELTGGPVAYGWLGLIAGVGLLLPVLGLTIVRFRRVALLGSAGSILIGTCVARYAIFAIGH